MRCNFRNQGSTASQCKVSILTYSRNQAWEWVAKKTEMATLVMLLGLGGGWIATEALAPQVAQADSERIEISLDRQQNETYKALVSRAETAALRSIEQSFEQDRLMTKVSVIIMGQNHGAIAPVLFLAVERTEWFNEPNLQRWVTYFRSARSLLGFEGVATTNTNQVDTASPNSPQQSEAATSDSETTNNTPANSGATPTPNSPPTQPGTATTITPAQTPSSEPGVLNRQPPATAPTIPVNNFPGSTSPNTDSNTGSSVPSGVIPATAPQTSSQDSFTNGINNSNPDNRGVIPDSNPLNTPIMPNSSFPATPLNTPGNLNNTAPEGTLD